MKIVFMGTPDFAVPILEGLVSSYDVSLVVSQPDKKVGRHQVLTPTPVKKCALDHNISVFQPEHIKNDYQQIIDCNPDIIITCAYGQMIPTEILELPKFGCINVHASLLPKLRGGAPIHKSIINGDSKTGITIMYMEEAMDSGDIISQSETEILDTDNLESLHDRLSIMGRDLLLETLPDIFNGTNSRVEQNKNEVTYAYNIKHEEEKIDFNKESRDIFNLIRGLSPVPGAFCYLDGQVFKVYSSRISDNQYENAKAGEVVKIYKDGIGVKTLDGEIIFTDVKPFSKKRMSAASYLNGRDRDSLIGTLFK